MARVKAYGRVGLLGPPSDIYGGKVISFTIDRFATAEVHDSDFLSISGNNQEERTLDFNGIHDLVKATIKNLGFQTRKFALNYTTNIPVGHGLAGSSAIIIATIKALAKHYKRKIKPDDIAELALHVECDEKPGGLGITAGPQDRYVIAYEGICFIDCAGKEYLRKSDPYAKVERLPRKELPYFLCLGKPKTEATVHNPLRERFLKGETRIKQHMDRIAMLAEQGKKCLLEENWKELGRLMNTNTDLREQISPHSPGDLEIIRKAQNLGALGARLAGSGGAVIVLTEEKSVFEQMCKEYTCIRPNIVYPPLQ